MTDDFLSQYIQYTSDTESPTFFHRWCAIISVGAMLARNYGFQHGHFLIHPNIYGMLMGEPGTRKSAAIKMMKSILQQTGYNTFNADKTTKEKFLMDLAGIDATYDQSGGLIKGKKNQIDDILDLNLWGNESEDAKSKPPAEVFIAADEFNNFFGNGNIEFISLLGDLWDYHGIYTSRIKNGKSIAINNPTVSILGGNTPTNFSLAFPVEIFGQGFFSRLLLIFAEPTGKRITFPTVPSTESTKDIIQKLLTIKKCAVGSASLSSDAKFLLDKIYQNPKDIDDVRFKTYASRRFVHLLKLCLICSACRYSNNISSDDVIYANTILTHTEFLMPKALGEFGKSKNSDIAHKITQLLDSSFKPMSVREIFKHIHNDLVRASDLSDILSNLNAADKIQNIHGVGWTIKKKIINQKNSDILNFNLLTHEEREMR